ncbi:MULTISPECIES: protein-tyrosine phosphatase family protein [Synechococcales]|uniref:protein-tyrosine phosphatase family protein n=1 Tax=unclassified Synechococcus TaxID=2626047 RepID=UPI0021A71D7A|nr:MULTISPECIES: dual specificity protein phosphatase [unclassified Synechococcus]MCT0213195.1 dual specificity protein phosphatase family protein [Synechococcus sp. CS-1326]MCT0233356.1 dual specificity protein phosphatase family protein [Synechococcus sp. CS-1327]
MFRISWVLTDALAVGPAPRAERHLDRLQREGVTAVLCLASEEEAPLPSGIKSRFAWDRLVLPDHRSERLVRVDEISRALVLLHKLRLTGPVFVHCVAAMERSPLICLAWLIRERKLSRHQALDYLMQAHSGTNPLPTQLEVLDEWIKVSAILDPDELNADPRHHYQKMYR